MSLSEGELLNQLTHLPPGTNPYQWLADLFKTQNLPRFSHSASTQMYFNIAMLDVCLALCLASLYLRYRKNHFWFFRRQIGRSLIQPNLNIVGGILGLLIMCLLNVLMFAIVQASNGRLPSYLGYLTFLEALFPCIIGEIIIWSIAASYLGHLYSTQSTDKPLEKWIVASNVAGIATPIVHLIAFLPLDVIAGKRYSNVVDSLRRIDALLLSQAKQWTPATAFNVNDLLPLVPLFSQLESDVGLLGPISRAIYVLHAITTVFLMIGTAIIATLYLSSIHKLIRKAKEGLLDSTRSSDMLDQIQQTWAGLLVVISLMSLITSTYFALTVYSAIHPLQSSQKYVLAAFWINTTLGLISTGIMFYLSYTLVPIKRRCRGNSDQGGGEAQVRRPRVRHETTLFRSEHDASTRTTIDLGVPSTLLALGRMESVEEEKKSGERNEEEKENGLYEVPFRD